MVVAITAFQFQTLAAETGGRFHRSHGDFNADLFAHKVLKEGFTDEVMFRSKTEVVGS